MGRSAVIFVAVPPARQSDTLQVTAHPTTTTVGSAWENKYSRQLDTPPSVPAHRTKQVATCTYGRVAANMSLCTVENGETIIATETFLQTIEGSTHGTPKPRWPSFHSQRQIQQ